MAKSCSVTVCCGVDFVGMFPVVGFRKTFATAEKYSHLSSTPLDSAINDDGDHQRTLLIENSGVD